ncbi:hypothetical protein, partial [Pseudomonas aeruginosa]|uniref:hypothetical protein n=1 Tax=Pseudomonas aeruginosa TaxID=287 RepID=UPI0039E0ACFB
KSGGRAHATPSFFFSFFVVVCFFFLFNWGFYVISGRIPVFIFFKKRFFFKLGAAPVAPRQLSDERLGHSPAKRHYSVEISPKFLQNVETIPRKTCLCL